MNQLHDSRLAAFSQSANPLDHAQRSALATVYQIILDSPHKRVAAQLQADGYTVRSGQVGTHTAPRVIVNPDARREKLLTDVAERLTPEAKDGA